MLQTVSLYHEAVLTLERVGDGRRPRVVVDTVHGPGTGGATRVHERSLGVAVRCQLAAEDGPAGYLAVIALSRRTALIPNLNIVLIVMNIWSQ